MPAQRPTLESLATELGVSRQTVSNVLNRPSIVAAPIRDRVAAAISAAGYVPSHAGRHLRTRSRAIGIRLMATFDGINGHIGDAFLHERRAHVGLATRAPACREAFTRARPASTLTGVPRLRHRHTALPRERRNHPGGVTQP